MAQLKTGPRRVLVVDNDAGRTSALLFNLRDIGIDCAAVETFAEAIEFLKRSEEIGCGIDAAIVAKQSGGHRFADAVRAMPAWENLPIVIAEDPSDLAAADPKSAAGLYHHAKRGGLVETVSSLLELHQGNGFDIYDKTSAIGLEPPANTSIDILVAEDNDINQLVIAQFLDTTGYSYRIVCSGRRAVHAYRYAKPRMILMDLSMPDMNGKEAAAAIRALESQDGTHIPIIALTAHALKGDREDCLASGMDHYVSKPIHFESLNALLDLYLRVKSKAA
ncbi:MAG: response regulator [Rhizobiaceae bacterium]